MSEAAAPTGSPAYTMILDQSAHLDWDWLRTFAQNYWYYTNRSGVDDILKTAVSFAQNQPDYFYTICEMGFLRHFVETHPEQISAIQKLHNQFLVISGGITSADHLVTSGEAFVRNYLVGQTWLKQELEITPQPHCWIPDDFGQSKELPVLLNALGFVGVAFSRLPGTYKWPNSKLKNQLIENGIDFIWKASDGSSVFAHWLVDRYGVGNDLSTSGASAIAATFIQDYSPNQASPPGYTAAKTPYMYIPIDDDFNMPVPDLRTCILKWNKNEVTFNGNPNVAKESNVQVLQQTFDYFYQKVMKEVGNLQVLAPYNGTPYLTGYYASRPALKRLHYETVRELTAAEVIGLLTQPSKPNINSMLPTDFWTRLNQAWTDFLPSTHHDFITGTAPDGVYTGDQLPILRGVASAASSLRAGALNALAGMVSTQTSPPPAGTGNFPGVIVTNSLGFSRSGIAAIEGIALLGSQFGWGNGTTQTSADGGMLVYATVPGFGYVVGNRQLQISPSSPDQTNVSPKTSGADSYTLSNEFLTAIISANADWGIASLTDTKNNGITILSDGAVANAITFYDDSAEGGIYSFSNEFNDSVTGPVQMPKLDGVKAQTTGACLGALILESGPLRVRIRTEVCFQYENSGTGVPNFETRFTREYELRAGECFLRMTTTGAAPTNTSVMTAFPLTQTVTGFTHGTAYHWTDYQFNPEFWGPPCFQPTHDFVIPYNNTRESLLAAIYHGSTPAWAFVDNVLLGCILRNAQSKNDPHGATGTDPAPHTNTYAIRVPHGLGQPETCMPLREAQSFHTPLYAMRLPDGPAKPYPGMLTATSGSLASTPADVPVVMTVAKPGSYDPTSLILRLYQPTNNQAQPLSVSVTLSDPSMAVSLMTATETEWKKTENWGVSVSGDTVTVKMGGAVGTVAIAGLGRPATGLN